MIYSHCGQAIPEKGGIGITLDGGFIFVDGKRVVASPHRAKIIRLLMFSPMTISQLFECLYHDDEDGGPLTGHKDIAASICAINRQLVHIGLEIVNLEGKGVHGGHYGLIHQEEANARSGVARDGRAA